jgi:mycothione reductase
MPSKMLIHSADIAEAVRDGRRFGITAKVESVDLPSIVHNVFEELDAETREREEDLLRGGNVEFVRAEGRFVGPKTMEVDGRRISADRVVIAGGTRPAVPPIKGRGDVPYLTSDEALHVSELPRRLAILGGGYIAVELGHFFGALGDEVTIIEMESRLIAREDSEIGELFTQQFSRKHNVMVSGAVESLERRDGMVAIGVQGSPQPVIADQLLIATGRRPNSDILDVTGNRGRARPDRLHQR